MILRGSSSSSTSNNTCWSVICLTSHVAAVWLWKAAWHFVTKQQTRSFIFGVRVAQHLLIGAINISLKYNVLCTKMSSKFFQSVLVHFWTYSHRFQEKSTILIFGNCLHLFHDALQLSQFRCIYSIPSRMYYVRSEIEVLPFRFTKNHLQLLGAFSIPRCTFEWLVEPAVIHVCAAMFDADEVLHSKPCGLL